MDLINFVYYIYVKNVNKIDATTYYLLYFLSYQSDHGRKNYSPERRQSLLATGLQNR